MNKKNILAIALAFVVSASFLAPKADASFNFDPKVTICHKPKTINQTLNISISALLTHLAHGDKLGKCNEIIIIEPTPTPQPTITPDPCNNEDLKVQLSDEIEQPCVTPTTEPQVTPSDRQVPDGEKSTTDAPGAAVCNIRFDHPLLQGFHADGNGSVTFSWWGVKDVDKYSIRYGYEPTALVYGADNIPSSSTSFTINGLTVGKNVWAIVSAYRGGCAEDSNILDPVVK